MVSPNCPTGCFPFGTTGEMATLLLSVIGLLKPQSDASSFYFPQSEIRCSFSKLGTPSVLVFVLIKPKEGIVNFAKTYLVWELIEVHCSQGPAVGRTVDWEPDAEAIILLDCYQPVAEPGRGTVGAFLQFWTFLIGGTPIRPDGGFLGTGLWYEALPTPFFLLYLPLQASDLKALPIYFCSLLLSCLYRELDSLNLLSMSNTILVSMYWRIWTGLGWVHHCRWQLCHILLERACPVSGIIMKNVGVLRRLGMALIHTSFWSKQGYISSMAFYLVNQSSVLSH